MKVRIGVGSGALAPEPDTLAGLARDLEDRRFDSLWLSEVLTAPVVDPLVGLAFAAAAAPRLKLGTTMVLPGRNPVRLAKELATLDRLCSGRLLVTFVVGINHPTELSALGVAGGDRTAQLDELMPLLRRLWSEDDVHHDGPGWSLDGVTVRPRPAQDPLEMWLGGTAPAALSRAGRLADGWLPSLVDPADAAAGLEAVHAAAEAAGRLVSPEHFGVSVGYATEPLTASAASRLGTRRVDPALVPVGLGALRDLLERYLSVGFSKFVVRPLRPPESWPAELDALAGAVGDLQR